MVLRLFLQYLTEKPKQASWSTQYFNLLGTVLDICPVVHKMTIFIYVFSSFKFNFKIASVYSSTSKNPITLLLQLFIVLSQMAVLTATCLCRIQGRMPE